MEMEGEQLIAADRETVWQALNDAEILKQCIPGCETINQINDNAFDATVALKIGPVKARFKGAVALKNKIRPQSYVIEGEGTGGIAGFAKGGAKVELVEEIGGTLLKYKVDAKVGGKIAQLGSRLIKSTSAKLANQFFEKFSEVVSKSNAA